MDFHIWAQALSTSEHQMIQRQVVAEFQSDPEMIEIKKDFADRHASYEADVRARRRQPGTWTEPSDLRARRLDRESEVEQLVWDRFYEASCA